MYSPKTISKTGFSFDAEAINQDQTTWWQDILLISIILGIFFSLFVGMRPLSVPDEARYSEIPREMVVSGDYVTPRLNTIKYFEKPALFYWLQAGSIRLFGLSELALRLPTLILGVLGCLITYVTSRALFNRRSGLVACAVLSTSILYFAMAHTITLDMAVSIFLTGCLSSFILAVDKPESMERNFLLWSAYAFSAFAVLTKGLIGILLPSAIIGIWIIACRQWKLLLKINLLSGVLLFFAITVPWHFLVQQANPEFFHFYFLEQQFLRYLTLYSKRYQPEWFFIPVLMLGFFPWIIFLMQSIRHHCAKIWKDRIQHKKSLFLIIWASIIFVFFSLSKSKLIPYILPIFPPLAMLVGSYLAEHLGTEKKFFRVEWCAFLIGSLVICAVLLALPFFDEVNDLRSAFIYLSMMAFSLIISVCMTIFYEPNANLKFGLTTLVFPLAFFLVLLNVTVAAVDTRSVKSLAVVLNERLKESDEVVAFHHYYQDLPFYVKRRVTVVDCRGELDFGMQHQDTRPFMVDDNIFWQRWNSNKRVYAIMSEPAYKGLKQKHLDLFFLASTKDNVLVANRAAMLNRFLAKPVFWLSSRRALFEERSLYSINERRRTTHNNEVNQKTKLCKKSNGKFDGS